MEIKPIETVYAGCRFRSRLEARWAVVFDRLDIKWHYEIQGYEIPGKGRYLPDFWLPTLGTWAEVKGRFGLGEWEKLLRAMDRGLPGDPLSPEIRSPRLLLLGDVPQPVGESAAVHAMLRKTSDRIEVRRVVLAENAFYEYGWIEPADSYSQDPDLLLAEAYVSAAANEAYRAGRSARFEFGESGR